LKIVECVANFSEGRNRRVVDAISEAIAGTPGVAVLDESLDADHHRSVITFAGAPDTIGTGAIRAVAEAVELIDLNFHSGVHPRIGAADVVPFVPVAGVDLADCAEIAVEIGREIWERLRVPVYLYEAAARNRSRAALEKVRRGGFEVLRTEIEVDPERRPDFGEPRLHPTAGATVVGARKFLIAYNVNLKSPDANIARAIARKIRASSGGFPNVKAMGLFLESRGQAQVSMNLTDYEVTPIHVVYAAIEHEAAAHGVEIADSELIGLIPRRAMENTTEHFLKLRNFRAQSIVETRIAELL
jgi:glutamate formiminotransferase